MISSDLLAVAENEATGRPADPDYWAPRLEAAGWKLDLDADPRKPAHSIIRHDDDEVFTKSPSFAALTYVAKYSHGHLDGLSDKPCTLNTPGILMGIEHSLWLLALHTKPECLKGQDHLDISEMSAHFAMARKMLEEPKVAAWVVAFAEAIAWGFRIPGPSAALIPHRGETH